MKRSVLVALLVGFLLGPAIAAPAAAQTEEVITLLPGASTGPSLELDANNLPITVWYDPSFNWLRFKRCTNETCTNFASRPLVKSVGDDPMPSLKIDGDEKPVVAYRNGDQLLVLRCDDADCIGGGFSQTPFSVEVVAEEEGLQGFPSLALDNEGVPVVSYRGGDGLLRVLKCLDSSCADTTEPVTIGSRNAVAGPSIAIGPDGNPVLAYTPDGRTSRLILCRTETCVGVRTVAASDVAYASVDLELSDLGDDSFDIRVGGATFGNSGSTTNQLRASGCNSSACSELSSVAGLVGLPETVRAADMAWSTSSDEPIFAFADGQVLGVASVDASQAGRQVRNGQRVVVPDPEHVGLSDLDIEVAGGRSWVAYTSGREIKLVRCGDEGCLPTCNGQPITLDLRSGLAAQANDVVLGTPENDNITSGKVICAGAGDDTISAGRDASVFAGAGNDRISLAGGKNFASGGPGDDVIVGASGRDRLFGGPGADSLDGRGGSDRIAGGGGNDTVAGGWGNDQLFGNLGRDSLAGGPGNDTIKGGAWIDSVDGGDGDDDRCGIVAGEVRVNCERGVFGT